MEYRIKIMLGDVEKDGFLQMVQQIKESAASKDSRI